MSVCDNRPKNRSQQGSRGAQSLSVLSLSTSSAAPPRPSIDAYTVLKDAVRGVPVTPKQIEAARAGRKLDATGLTINSAWDAAKQRKLENANELEKCVKTRERVESVLTGTLGAQEALEVARIVAGQEERLRRRDTDRSVESQLNRFASLQALGAAAEGARHLTTLPQFSTEDETFEMIDRTVERFHVRENADAVFKLSEPHRASRMEQLRVLSDKDLAAFGDERVLLESKSETSKALHMRDPEMRRQVLSQLHHWSSGATARADIEDAVEAALHNTKLSPDGYLSLKQVEELLIRAGVKLRPHGMKKFLQELDPRGRFKVKPARVREFAKNDVLNDFLDDLDVDDARDALQDVVGADPLVAGGILTGKHLVNWMFRLGVTLDADAANEFLGEFAFPSAETLLKEANFAKVQELFCRARQAHQTVAEITAEGTKNDRLEDEQGREKTMEDLEKADTVMKASASKLRVIHQNLHKQVSSAKHLASLLPTKFTHTVICNTEVSIPKSQEGLWEAFMLSRDGGFDDDDPEQNKVLNVLQMQNASKTDEIVRLRMQVHNDHIKTSATIQLLRTELDIKTTEIELLKKRITDLSVGPGGNIEPNLETLPPDQADQIRALMSALQKKLTNQSDDYQNSVRSAVKETSGLKVRAEHAEHKLALEQKNSKEMEMRLQSKIREVEQELRSREDLMSNTAKVMKEMELKVTFQENKVKEISQRYEEMRMQFSIANDQLETLRKASNNVVPRQEMERRVAELTAKYTSELSAEVELKQTLSTQLQQLRNESQKRVIEHLDLQGQHESKLSAMQMELEAVQGDRTSLSALAMNTLKQWMETLKCEREAMAKCRGLTDLMPAFAASSLSAMTSLGATCEAFLSMHVGDPARAAINKDATSVLRLINREKEKVFSSPPNSLQQQLDQVRGEAALLRQTVEAQEIELTTQRREAGEREQQLAEGSKSIVDVMWLTVNKVLASSDTEFLGDELEMVVAIDEALKGLPLLLESVASRAKQLILKTAARLLQARQDMLELERAVMDSEKRRQEAETEHAAQEEQRRASTVKPLLRTKSDATIGEHKQSDTLLPLLDDALFLSRLQLGRSIALAMAGSVGRALELEGPDGVVAQLVEQLRGERAKWFKALFRGAVKGRSAARGLEDAMKRHAEDTLQLRSTAQSGLRALCAKAAEQNFRTEFAKQSFGMLDFQQQILQELNSVASQIEEAYASDERNDQLEAEKSIEDAWEDPAALEAAVQGSVTSEATEEPHLMHSKSRTSSARASLLSRTGSTGSKLAGSSKRLSHFAASSASDSELVADQARSQVMAAPVVTETFERSRRMTRAERRSSVASALDGSLCASPSISETPQEYRRVEGSVMMTSTGVETDEVEMYDIGVGVSFPPPNLAIGTASAAGSPAPSASARRQPIIQERPNRGRGGAAGPSKSPRADQNVINFVPVRNVDRHRGEGSNLHPPSLAAGAGTKAQTASTSTQTTAPYPQSAAIAEELMADPGAGRAGSAGGTPSGHIGDFNPQPVHRVGSASIPRPSSSGSRPMSAVALDDGEASLSALKAPALHQPAAAAKAILDELLGIRPEDNNEEIDERNSGKNNEAKQRPVRQQKGKPQRPLFGVKFVDVEFPVEMQVDDGLASVMETLFDTLPPHCRVPAAKYCLLALFSADMSSQVFAEYVTEYHFGPNPFLVPMTVEQLHSAFAQLSRIGKRLMRGAPPRPAADLRTTKGGRTQQTATPNNALLHSLIDGVSPALSILQQQQQHHLQSSSHHAHQFSLASPLSMGRRPYSANSDPQHKVIFDATNPPQTQLPATTPVPFNVSGIQSSEPLAGDQSLLATVAKKLPLSGEIASLLGASEKRCSSLPTGGKMKMAEVRASAVPLSKFEPVAVRLQHDRREEADAPAAHHSLPAHRHIPVDASSPPITPMQLILILREQRRVLRQEDEMDLASLSVGAKHAGSASSAIPAAFEGLQTSTKLSRAPAVIRGGKVRPASGAATLKQRAEQQLAVKQSEALQKQHHAQLVVNRLSRIASAQVTLCAGGKETGLPPIGSAIVLMKELHRSTSAGAKETKRRPQDQHVKQIGNPASVAMIRQPSTLSDMLQQFPSAIGAAVTLEAKQRPSAGAKQECDPQMEELIAAAAASCTTTPVDQSKPPLLPSRLASPTSGESPPMADAGRVSGGSSPLPRVGSFDLPRPAKGRAGLPPPRPASGGSIGAWDGHTPR